MYTEISTKLNPLKGQGSLNKFIQKVSACKNTTIKYDPPPPPKRKNQSW